MKVSITTTKELKKPHLNLDINLEAGTIHVTLTYTCTECEGYGCHGGCGNNGRTILEPENIAQTLGPEVKALLTKLLGRCLMDA